MAKWGYCDVKARDHELSDFGSRQIQYGKNIMNVTVCRHCGAYPNGD